MVVCVSREIVDSAPPARRLRRAPCRTCLWLGAITAVGGRMSNTVRQPPRPTVDAELTQSRPNEAFLRKVLTEVGLRAQEIRHALDTEEEALIAFDAGRTIVGANRKAERLLGYGPGELEGCSTDILIPERLRQPDAPPM